MVNKKFTLGILVIVLVFGMSVIGCKDDPINEPVNDPALIGTWVTKYSFLHHSGGAAGYYNEEEGVWESEEWEDEWLEEWEGEVKFDGSNFERSYDYPIEKGTYTTNAGIITTTVTQINGDYYKYRFDDVNLESKWYSESELKDMEYITNKELAVFIVQTFTPKASIYSINDNKLTFDLAIWTKKD